MAQRNPVAGFAVRTQDVLGYSGPEYRMMVWHTAHGVIVTSRRTHKGPTAGASLRVRSDPKKLFERALQQLLPDVRVNFVVEAADDISPRLWAVDMRGRLIDGHRIAYRELDHWLGEDWRSDAEDLS